MDKYVFLFLYNPVGFEYFSFRFKRVLKFIFDRIRYHRKVYNLLSHTHQTVLKNSTLDLTLKSIIRDYNLLIAYKTSTLYRVFDNSGNSSNLIKFVNLYFTFYRFYCSTYYYWVGSVEEGIKTYDWRPVNNYYIIFISVFSLGEDNDELTYINLSNISEFYYFNVRYDSFFYKIEKRGYSENPFEQAYLNKLGKLKQAYTNLYKPYLNFQIFSKAVQNFTVAKYKLNTYVNIDKIWKNTLNRLLVVRFNDSSVTKHIHLNDLKNYTIFYIRKNRIFNKSRYSRNRQLYRTGVYWCLWLNVLIVYGLYFYFYRFTFNFGYIWWGLGFFVFSFIFSRAVQHNFYNINMLYAEFSKTYSWFLILISNFFIFFSENWKLLYNRLISHLYANIFVFNFLNSDIWFRFFRSINWFSLDFGPKHHQRFAYVWEYFIGEDTSFLKYKSLIHWFKQVWKMLTTY